MGSSRIGGQSFLLSPLKRIFFKGEKVKYSTSKLVFIFLIARECFGVARAHGLHVGTYISCITILFRCVYVWIRLCMISFELVDNTTFSFN